MKLNRPNRNTTRTHEGAPAFGHLKPIEQLRRSVMACMLWEREFYEDGVEIAERITSTALKCSAADLAALAVEARHAMKLRHAPLLLLEALTVVGKHQTLVADTFERVIQRADELAEFLAIYWRKGKHPLSAQAKIGLARAFRKFDVYQLAKYDRPGKVKLRDVLRLTHPVPRDEAQADLWRRLLAGELVTADTWETGLSAGADKNQVFTRLLEEGKLGYMALLRNLRNMEKAGVDRALVKQSILARKGAQWVLPFRFVAAARAVPSLEPVLDEALIAGLKDGAFFDGPTVVLVDVSDSMNWSLSKRSDMTRMDAACALASIIVGEEVRVFSFSWSLVEVPYRLGMAGVDAIRTSQRHAGTNLGEALHALNNDRKLPHERLIVISDEQSHTRVPVPNFKRAYMINVASNQNGVGYGQGWTHMDGFSESVLQYIHAVENARIDFV